MDKLEFLSPDPTARSARWQQLKDDPILSEWRRLRDEPKLTASRTDKVFDKRPKLRTDNDDPRCVNCNTLACMTEPKWRTSPCTLHAEPILEKLRIDKVDPYCTKSKAES
jgi:hypothetical protein